MKIWLALILAASAPAWAHDCESHLRMEGYLGSLAKAGQIFWSGHSREKIRRSLAPWHFASVPLPHFEWPEIEHDPGMRISPLSYAPRASVTVGPRIVYSEVTVRQIVQKFELNREDYLLDVAGAHEIGHHIQLLMGLSVESFANRNEGFYRLELMADCLAGVFLRRHGPDWREPYVQVFTQAGSDRMRSNPPKELEPEHIRSRKLHPYSQSRVRWFHLGWESGDAGICDSLRPALEDLI